jgi:hypothetical protein
MVGRADPTVHKCSVLTAESVGWKVAKTREVQPLGSDDRPISQNLRSGSVFSA